MSTPIITSSDNSRLYFNKYCREHCWRIADPDDHEHQEFFNQINNDRDKYFNSSLELYTGVILRDHNQMNRGFIDFAQEGLVAKLHIHSPRSRTNTVKRARARKSTQLRTAQSFFEEITRHPFRAIRIDRIYESGVWQVRAVDVTYQNSIYRKL